MSQDNVPLAEAEVRNSELAAKLENVTRKVDQLQELVQRLEERLSNSESEIQVLRQQTPESEEKPQENLNEKQQESQDLLVKCISENLGFARGKPVAACLIFKCLLHWSSFVNIFDRIIQTLVSAIEKEDDNEVLAYWLSNSATLLLLLQRTSPGSQGLTKLDELRQIEAKYLKKEIFKQHLTAYLEKIYEMLRDNLKKEISPYIPQGDMQSIVQSLNTYLNLMKANNAPTFLVRRVFTQVFFFINVQLFNSLLPRSACTIRSATYFEVRLAELKQWCVEATDEYAGSAWDELMHMRQAIGFLVLRRKPKMTRKLCPVLSPQQRYSISKMCWDCKYGSRNNFPEISRIIRLAMEESNACLLEDDKDDDTFLLDDDSSIPFTVEDISKSMQQVDLYDIELPQLLRENPHIFGFLLPRKNES